MDEVGQAGCRLYQGKPLRLRSSEDAGRQHRGISLYLVRFKGLETFCELLSCVSAVRTAQLHERTRIIAEAVTASFTSALTSSGNLPRSQNGRPDTIVQKDGSMGL